MQEKIYIVDGLRTPIGNPNKSLKKFSAAQLASIVIKELIYKNKIKSKLIDEIILGNVVSSGNGQNIARQAALFAGLPSNIEAYTANNVCGAGMLSVVLAVQSLLAKKSNIIIAGGTESTSNSPYLIKDPGKKEEPVNSLINDGLRCNITKKRMGELVEVLVRKNKISRTEQDEYSLESHKKACRAQDHNLFEKEIIPIAINKRNPVVKDDRPKRKIDLDILKELPPAFEKGGTLTVGNSSIPCDGAAGVIIASKEMVDKFRLKPCASIIGYSSVWDKPESSFELAVPAINKCLKDCRMSIKDIDLFEISEAFSAQMIYTIKKLNLNNEKINVFGGDIALGHPLGAAGARILVTLIKALRKKGLKRGIAGISFGGGGAMAMLIEEEY